jgi:antitoxin component YwqK of YwqJK toxin-antitoxin module
MTKRILISIQIFISLSAYSQSTLPDNFKIGNFFEVYSKDSLRIYFNCTGTIVDKKCASFYRIGKMDTSIINFVGEFYDFDINGNLYFKATMTNNNIEGYAYYYFKNGKISEEGNFKNNTRTGKWKYYYPSGEVEKIYSYDSDEPIVLEAYKKNGTATVINGNGIIHTEFRNYKQCSSFETWGNLVNGKKNGKWTFSNINASMPIASETYQDGAFINGSSNNYVYTENPKITLNKYYPNENLNLVENSLGCPGESGIYFWEYDGSNLTSSFYPKLQEEVSNNVTNQKNQWLVVGLKIDRSNQVQEINLASSINDTELENKIYAILKKMKKWQAALINSKPIDSNIYFSILVDNNQIIILPDYIHKNS